VKIEMHFRVISERDLAFYHAPEIRYSTQLKNMIYDKKLEE